MTELLLELVLSTGQFGKYCRAAGWVEPLKIPSCADVENICSTARVASCSSSPITSTSIAVPVVAHSEMMLKILRRSAFLAPHFKKIVERNNLAKCTSFAAWRRCNPSRQGTITLEFFI
jgi:hypothetical protein